MKSCDLLRGSNLSIAEIAEEVGYASLSCFNRHFIELNGCTPSRWRNLRSDARRTTLIDSRFLTQHRFGVGKGQCGKNFRRHSSQFSKKVACVNDKSRFIGLSALRHGRKERRVRLN